MTLRPSDLRPSARPQRRWRFPGRWLFSLAISAVIVSIFALRGFERGSGPPGKPLTRLSAEPSKALIGALRDDAVPFVPMLVDHIRSRGHLTVTIHVALFEGRNLQAVRRFGDGAQPKRNLYWGAYYGIETHFANEAGWRRAYTDDGDGGHILRRVVFHRQAAASPAWRDLGVDEAFDVYVLANAWPSSRIVEAMEQPIRDAICGEPVTLAVDGLPVAFASGSEVVGYVGQNHLLEEHWDVFARLGACRPEQQTGVFFACPRSAVVLHREIIDRGLYPVLFTRTTVMPEAYLTDGLLDALLSGTLDDGFLAAAAAEYTRYQKSVTPAQAARMFVR